MTLNLNRRIKFNLINFVEFNKNIEFTPVFITIIFIKTSNWLFLMKISFINHFFWLTILNSEFTSLFTSTCQLSSTLILNQTRFWWFFFLYIKERLLQNFKITNLYCCRYILCFCFYSNEFIALLLMIHNFGNGVHIVIMRCRKKKPFESNCLEIWA